MPGMIGANTARLREIATDVDVTANVVVAVRIRCAPEVGVNGTLKIIGAHIGREYDVPVLGPVEVASDSFLGARVHADLLKVQWKQPGRLEAADLTGFAADAGRAD